MALSSRTKKKHDVLAIRAALSVAHNNSDGFFALPELPMIKDDEILKSVFTHPSATADSTFDVPSSYERLECLGDSVLGYLVNDILIHKFPTLPEGMLTKYKNSLVCNKMIREWSLLYRLPSHVLSAPSSFKVEDTKCPSDIFEAYIGGYYLDSERDGETLMKWLELLIDPVIDKLANGEEVSISSPTLNNLARTIHLTRMPARKFARNELYNILCPHFVPIYQVVEENNSLGDHKKIFRVACIVNGEVLGVSAFSTIKEAANLAAYDALSYNREKINRYSEENNRSKKGEVFHDRVSENIMRQVRNLGNPPLLMTLESDPSPVMFAEAMQISNQKSINGTSHRRSI